MSSEKKNSNHLASESSPYLLQHADNPVNWHPWGNEAFKKAKEEDKPIFVSIGYATCHWCHVMAHECFEDDEIAALMNESFVNIKVDREERPDIDNTYMLVCQMLTGSGGWPLNVFLTPKKKPFYAATYIPKHERHGQPGMFELIPWISDLWKNEREKVASSSQEIMNAFQKSNSFSSGEGLSEDVLYQAYRQYSQRFDDTYGGFGSSPKFPSPHNLMLLLRCARQNPDSNARHMVEKTMTKMRLGGLFDQIGLGFHRYSTDRQWLVPHFEKMLYDQAMLLIAYTEAWQLTKNELFRDTAQEIARYVLRKMQDDKGGFYSAEDADSEGEEGKFYVWSIDEIDDILSPSEAALYTDAFNITEQGNYNDEASGRRTGKNIPHLEKPISELTEEREMKGDELADSLKIIRKKLFTAREKRVHPLLDDKILTDWNGLMIAALAKAGRAFGKEEYIQQAERCRQFITSHMLKDGKNLKHRYRKGNVAIRAHADDYAFLIWGLIELYESSFDSSCLAQAIALNNQLIEHFWDDRDGGFYFTSDSAEKLLGRTKEIHDGALPSGSSVAMMNLLRLSRLTGNTQWEQKVEVMQKLFSADIKKAPTGFSFALQSVDFAFNDSQEIIIVGKKKDSATQEMLSILRKQFLPNAVILLKDPDDILLQEIAPYLADFSMKNDNPTAYVCQNYRCQQPANDPHEMLDLIESHS